MKREKSQPLENYLVFARKFRPQLFDEVIGQEPIVTTLKSAIAQNRVAQSFLFTGPRGVGKTSTARILAKALNCEKGPTAAPCNACTACDEITRGTSLDVLEIDGASNRGIEEIRSLRENVKFKPASGRFKVYIIDEVHMLTGEAFNALLKTLEEPPAHVKFVFATTEVHKVPLTILSRCQRFNFRRIPTGEIAKQLKEISKKEKIKAADKVLFRIAQSAEGSLRDGESLLDQLASFSASAGEMEIKEEDVNFSLGLTSEEAYFSILKFIQERNAEAALHELHCLAEAGADLIQFARGLLELFRDVLMYQVGGDAEKLVEGTEERKAELKTAAKAFSREELFFILALCQQLVRDIRWSSVPKFLIETSVLKMLSRSDLRPVASLLEELKQLRKGSAFGAGSPQKPFEPKQAATLPEPEKKKEHFSPKPAGQVIERSSAKASGVSLNEVGRVWPELLERLKQAKMSCGTFLSEAEPVEVIDGLVVFGLPNEFKFHKEALEKPDNRELVRATLSSLLGEDVRVSFVVTAPECEPVPAKKPEAISAKDADMITAALNLFDGSKVIYRET